MLKITQKPAGLYSSTDRSTSLPRHTFKNTTSFPMVCQILHKAFGERKPQDADGVNAYCRQQSSRLVLRHLQQLYDDLNGSAFHQSLDSGNQLHSTPAGDQLPLAQPVTQLPLVQPGNQLPLAHTGNQTPFIEGELPIDELSRRQSLPPDSHSTDYYTPSTKTYSHIHQWLEESNLPMNSQPRQSQQPATPHVTVIRPSSPSDDHLDTPKEKRGRTLSFPQGNATGTSLPQRKAKGKIVNALKNKCLPELPMGSQTNITVQDITDISCSNIPNVNLPDRLRIQEAGPSSPFKNVLKLPRRNSTIASTTAEGICSRFEKDLGLLSNVIVAQIEFCRELLVVILPTEPAVQQNLKKVADLLRQKSSEELEKFGLLELEKLYLRSSRLSDRIKKRYNAERVRKICEEVNPTVEVWIDRLQVSQDLSEISDTSEGVAGLQARRISMAALRIGKLRESQVENSVNLALQELQASDTGTELFYATPRFIYVKKQ